MSKKRKVRVELRKNRQNRTRSNDLTRRFDADGARLEQSPGNERIRAKGELSRRRTIITTQDSETDNTSPDSAAEIRAVDLSACVAGRVIKVLGSESHVAGDDGQTYRCGVRRVLKSLSIDARHVITVGDRVWILPGGNGQGTVEKVEPRHGTVTRGYRRACQIIASNIDQLLIVSAFGQPGLKLPLIDRYLISAEMGSVRPVIVLNKSDLVSLADYQWVIGLYGQLGYDVLVTSAVDGRGMDRLRTLVSKGATAFSGQSGVGKSSLLNAIEPDLKLRIGEVSDWTLKGKHTTTTAELIPLRCGGHVIDTPGLRQFELWGVDPGELEGYFPEFRAYVSHCRFPDCSHTHEHSCAVKDAVHADQIHIGRYESYLKLYHREPLAGE